MFDGIYGVFFVKVIEVKNNSWDYISSIVCW